MAAYLPLHCKPQIRPLRRVSLKERQLQREAEDYKADTDSASQQLFQAVAQKVYAFLQQYAKQHAYSIVIDRGSEANPIVWYAAAKFDITEQLIKAYDIQANSAPAGKGATSKTSSGPEGSSLPSAPPPQ